MPFSPFDFDVVTSPEDPAQPARQPDAGTLPKPGAGRTAEAPELEEGGGERQDPDR